MMMMMMMMMKKKRTMKISLPSHSASGRKKKKIDFAIEIAHSCLFLFEQNHVKCTLL